AMRRTKNAMVAIPRGRSQRVRRARTGVLQRFGRTATPARRTKPTAKAGPKGWYTMAREKWPWKKELTLRVRPQPTQGRPVEAWKPQAAMSMPVGGRTKAPRMMPKSATKPRGRLKTTLAKPSKPMEKRGLARGDAWEVPAMGATVGA